MMVVVLKSPLISSDIRLSISSQCPPFDTRRLFLVLKQFVCYGKLSFTLRWQWFSNKHHTLLLLCPARFAYIFNFWHYPKSSLHVFLVVLPTIIAGMSSWARHIISQLTPASYSWYKFYELTYLRAPWRKNLIYTIILP